MNYAAIKPTDVANGPGGRGSLFVSGCTHHCKGCFNSEAWDFSYGEPFTKEVQQGIFHMLAPDYIVGLTLLGGEPLEPANQEGLFPFVREVRRRFPEKSVWCFTGYDFETDILKKMLPDYPVSRELIPLIDVIVDGKFIAGLKNLRLKFRGSENQRILDVKRSLKEGKAVWMEEYR